MKILLIRLRLIGDVVFTTPTIHALRRRYPDAHLTYLVESHAATVVRGNPDLDDVIVTPRRRGVARLRDDLVLAKRLRRDAFDIAIDFHGGPRSGWLTWASGAPMRIGYTIRGRTWMYTHPVPRPADLAPRHSVVNQWDLLAPLGFDAPDPVRDPVQMPDDPIAAEAIDRRLGAAGISEATPIVVVHVSAGNAFRRWPAESFERLLVELAGHDTSRRIIVTSGPSDTAVVQRITEAARRRLGSLAVAVPDVGEFDLAELRALIARSAVYIGGDSGPVHVAATTTTPIVELLGPTLPERSRPWRDPKWYAETLDVGALSCRPCRQRHCVPGDFRCLVGLSPDRVIEAAERAIDHAARPHRSGEARLASGADKEVHV